MEKFEIEKIIELVAKANNPRVIIEDNYIVFKKLKYCLDNQTMVELFQKHLEDQVSLEKREREAIASLNETFRRLMTA